MYITNIILCHNCAYTFNLFTPVSPVADYQTKNRMHNFIIKQTGT